MTLLIARLGCVPCILAARNTRIGKPLDDQELSDLAQDTVAAVWGKLHTFQGQAALETWVYRFCEHELRNAVRRKRREARVIDRQPEDAMETKVASDAAEDFDDVHAGLAKLAPAEEEIIRLRHFCELSFDEIATRLNVPYNTVKTRYYRGIERLRHVLRPSQMEGRS